MNELILETMSEAELVDQLVRFEKDADRSNKQKSRIESRLQEIGQKRIENTKYKQAVIFGTNGNSIEITNSESLKVNFMEIVKDIFSGKIQQDILKPKEGYDLTNSFKKIMTPICQGNYDKVPVQACISQIGLTDKQAKKLKGDFNKDKKCLMSLGYEEKDAEENAYLLAESFAYERFNILMKAAGYEPGTEEYNEIVEKLTKTALIVEESIKITPKYKKDE
jgi:hypothetical protein